MSGPEGPGWSPAPDYPIINMSFGGDVMYISKQFLVGLLVIVGTFWVLAMVARSCEAVVLW